MRRTIGPVLLFTTIAAIAAPNVAFAGAAGCAHGKRQYTELALIGAMIASGGALMFRRRRIPWRDQPPE